MQIVWPQFANAITMVSPLISWFHHRIRMKNTSKKKNKLEVTRLLLVHIPISFGYHMLSAFSVVNNIRTLFKIADLSLIHIYALKASNALRNKRLSITYGGESNINATLCKASSIMNSICVMRIVSGHEDTLARVLSLYICTYNALKKEPKLTEISKVGAVSSILFIFDEHLMHMGHPTFHIVLGYLHHQILSLL